MPMKYTSVFATPEHKVITDISEARGWNCTMGFFLNGRVIGTGQLNRVGKGKVNSKILCTSSTEIFPKFRNKGHGIHLYIALVETARSLGAIRIRSDSTLNKLSRRMWQEKLAKIYTVKVRRSQNPCSRCGRTPNFKYFWIDLKK